MKGSAGENCPTCKQPLYNKSASSPLRRCKKVLDAVVKATKHTEAAIMGKSRDAALVKARWLVTHISHDFLGLQKSVITEFFDCDHSNIYAALKGAHRLDRPSADRQCHRQGLHRAISFHHGEL